MLHCYMLHVTCYNKVVTHGARFIMLNGSRRAESPMASIAQGKRSDTLGKPPHHATPCVRVKVNAIGSVSTLLPLHGASCTAHFYPGRRFACRWAMDFCPFGACPLNAPAKDLCHPPRQGRDLWEPNHPERHLCPSARSVGNKKHPAWPLNIHHSILRKKTTLNI